MYKLKNTSGPKTGTKRILPMVNGKRVRVDEVIETEILGPFQGYINTGQFTVVKRKRTRKKIKTEELVLESNENPENLQPVTDSITVEAKGPEPEEINPPKKKRKRRKKKNAPFEIPITDSDKGLSSPTNDGDNREG